MSGAGLLSRLARFGAVGALGFVVDAGATEALAGLGLAPTLARTPAIAAAIATTYALNRSLTFRSGARGRAALAEGGRYLAVALASAGVNWLVFAAVMTALPGLRPLLGVGLASAVATAVSFAGYSTVVFGRRPA